VLVGRVPLPIVPPVQAAGSVGATIAGRVHYSDSTSTATSAKLLKFLSLSCFLMDPLMAMLPTMSAEKIASLVNFIGD